MVRDATAVPFVLHRRLIDWKKPHPLPKRSKLFQRSITRWERLGCAVLLGFLFSRFGYLLLSWPPILINTIAILNIAYAMHGLVTSSHPAKIPRDHSDVKAHIVGGGLGGLAAAVNLVQEGDVPGENITVYESETYTGGTMDGFMDDQSRLVARGNRWYVPSFYTALAETMKRVPDIDLPHLNVYEAQAKFHQKMAFIGNSRLIAADGHILSCEYGLSFVDKVQMLALVYLPEGWIGKKAINEHFGPHFLSSNFWYMWRTSFAFQEWHSAIEMKRYMVRFFHDLPAFPTYKGAARTQYNNYDSIGLPLEKYLREQGVKFVLNTDVIDADFKTEINGDRYCTHFTAVNKETGEETIVELGHKDIAIMSLGSMGADATFGDNEKPPPLQRDMQSVSWNFWKKIAAKEPGFGHPEVFIKDPDASKFLSFTLTMKDPKHVLKKYIEDFTNTLAGRNGLVSLRDAPWLINLHLYPQPYCRGQSEDVDYYWGCALFPDNDGLFVKQPMAKCGGKQMLEEVLHHLQLHKHPELYEHVMETTDVLPCYLPYTMSEFMLREPGDRPPVVPTGSKNFAFIGQYVEIPKDIVFTLDYSCRGAIIAVKELLKLDHVREPTIPDYRFHLPVMIKNAITTNV